MKLVKATHAIETTKGDKRRENNLKATHAVKNNLKATHARKTTYKRHTL